MVSGRWSYNLSNPPLLSDGETATDTFTLTASDGSTQIITITIHGADAAPVLTAPAAGSIDEIAGSSETKASGLTGTLIASDADGDRLAMGSQVAAPRCINTCRRLWFAQRKYQHGVYVYLPNESATVSMRLQTGQMDSFALTVMDGHHIDSDSWTVAGADDTSVITGDSAGTLNDDLGGTVSGSLAISDADADDAPILPISNLPARSGLRHVFLGIRQLSYSPSHPPKGVMERRRSIGSR